MVACPLACFVQHPKRHNQVLRIMLRVTVKYAANAVPEYPERGLAPHHLRAEAVIGAADFVVRLVVHTAVERCRICQRHLPDLTDILWETMPRDFNPGLVELRIR